MPEPSRPLESWADRARKVFWGAFALVPILSLLDGAGAIDRGRGGWLAVSIVVSVVWTVSLATWGLGAWRRRRPSAR